jgi:hypothetical protein
VQAQVARHQHWTYHKAVTFVHPNQTLAPMCALQAEVCPHSPTTPPRRVTYGRIFISPYLESPPGGALRQPGRQSRNEHSPNGQRNRAVCGHSLHDSGLDGVSSSPGVDGARGEVAGESNGRGEEGEGAGLSIGYSCMNEPQGTTGSRCIHQLSKTALQDVAEPSLRYA